MSEEIGIVLCDVDEVVFDLLTPWLAIYNKIYKDSLTKDDITHYNLIENIKPECGNSIFDILYYNHSSIYKDIKIIPGAKEGIQEIKKLGYKVVFCTSGVMLSKIEALARHGLLDNNNIKNIMWPEDVIIAKNKHLVNGILIDDYHKNLNKNDILFKRNWSDPNYHKGDVANSWDEVVNILRNRIIK